MKISALQTNIVWEDKQANLQLIAHQLANLSGQADLVVLPEMFSTGFTMNCEILAEPITGPTITALRAMASKYHLALAGSYIAREDEKCYNRGFFLTPEGAAHFYDKRHLFRMGEEGKHFAPGNNKLIVSYKGWNICLLVCYDLRFPVWSRNVGNQYDLLIYTANWPTSRRRVWDTLLPARAIENMCYVCGSNRIGTDGNHLAHNGGSCVISPKGEILAQAKDDEEEAIIQELDLDGLRMFREKFPVWKDADGFEVAPPSPLKNKC